MIYFYKCNKCGDKITSLDSPSITDQKYDEENGEVLFEKDEQEWKDFWYSQIDEFDKNHKCNEVK